MAKVDPKPTSPRPCSRRNPQNPNRVSFSKNASQLPCLGFTLRAVIDGNRRGQVSGL
jgi:hypothetical protein